MVGVEIKRSAAKMDCCVCLCVHVRLTYMSTVCLYVCVCVCVCVFSLMCVLTLQSPGPSPSIGPCHWAPLIFKHLLSWSPPCTPRLLKYRIHTNCHMETYSQVCMDTYLDIWTQLLTNVAAQIRWETCGSIRNPRQPVVAFLSH